MNRKEKLAVRILLLAAQLLASEPWSKAIKEISDEVRFWTPETPA